jgi:Holliday junction resolvase RusA-like endonuclease
MRINIEPFSVNKAWKGRRYRTDAYIYWRSHLILMLPKASVPTGNFSIYIKFGIHSRLADFDNPVKTLIDGLQERYGFNDKQIKQSFIEVENVAKKSDEFIEFYFIDYPVDIKNLLGLT